MKLKIFFALFLLFTGISTLSAQVPPSFVLWEKNFAPAGLDTGMTLATMMAELQNGDLAIYSQGIGFGSSILTRTKSNGNEVWRFKRFEKTNTRQAVFHIVEEKEDGTILCIGQDDHADASFTQISLSATGQQLLDTVCQDCRMDFDYTSQFFSSPSGGYIMTNNSRFYRTAIHNIWKCDREGHILDSLVAPIGDDGRNASLRVIGSDSKNNLWFAGATYPPQMLVLPYAVGYIVKTDKDLKQLWTKSFLQDTISAFSTFRPTKDGGAIIAFSYFFAEKNISYTKVIKLDENGNEIWQRLILPNSIHRINDIIETSDGGFLAVGHTGKILPSFWGGKEILKRICFTVRLDQTGNVLWNQSWGTPISSTVISDPSGLEKIYSAGNDEYFVCGSLNSRAYIAKIKDAKEVSGVDDLSAKTDDFFVFPSPTENTITISVKESGICRIFNSLGILLAEKECESGTTELSVSKFPQGVYLVKFQGQNFLHTQKFLKIQ